MRGRRQGTLPEPLGPSLARELTRLGGNGRGSGDLADLLNAWAEAVGPAVAGNAWPARFRQDGTLIVHTSSSAWAFELSQLEDTVRAKLGELAPSRLQFVVGPLPEPPPPAPDVSQSIPRAGCAERERGAEIAHAIEDQELRELVSRAAAAALARDALATGSAGESDRL